MQGSTEVGHTSQHDVMDSFLVLDLLLMSFSIDSTLRKCLQSTHHGTTERRDFLQPTMPQFFAGKESIMTHIDLPPLLVVCKAHPLAKILLVGNFARAGQKIRRAQLCFFSVWILRSRSAHHCHSSTHPTAQLGLCFSYVRRLIVYQAHLTYTCARCHHC
jgi:hypothetical protein